MSRQDVLVTADWAEKNLDAPTGSSSSRSTRTPPPTTAATSPAPSSSTGRPSCRTRSAATSSTRSSFEQLLSAKGIAQRRHRRPLRRQQQLVRRLRVLVLQALRPRERQAARRRPQEVGARRPPARPATRSRPAGAPPTRPRTPDLSIRAFRDEVVDAIGAKNLVDVRSPDEFSGKILAPAHLPQEQSQRPGHIPTAINVPWSKAANEDGTFKSDDELRQALRRGRARRLARRPSPTAASASAPRTPGSCCSELLGHENVKNYDGSWTEYGSLVGVPIELGDGQGAD